MREPDTTMLAASDSAAYCGAGAGGGGGGGGGGGAATRGDGASATAFCSSAALKFIALRRAGVAGGASSAGAGGGSGAAMSCCGEFERWGCLLRLRGWSRLNGRRRRLRRRFSLGKLSERNQRQWNADRGDNRRGHECADRPPMNAGPAGARWTNSGSRLVDSVEPLQSCLDGGPPCRRARRRRLGQRNGIVAFDRHHPRASKSSIGKLITTIAASSKASFGRPPAPGASAGGQEPLTLEPGHGLGALRSAHQLDELRPVAELVRTA